MFGSYARQWRWWRMREGWESCDSTAPAASTVPWLSKVEVALKMLVPEMSRVPVFSMLPLDRSRLSTVTIPVMVMALPVMLITGRFDVAGRDARTAPLPAVRTNYKPGGKNGALDYLKGKAALATSKVPSKA